MKSTYWLTWLAELGLSMFDWIKCTRKEDQHENAAKVFCVNLVRASAHLLLKHRQYSLGWG